MVNFYQIFMVCKQCSGKFSLVGTLAGHMVTYPIVIGGGGGTNLCSNSGGGVIF